MTIRVNYIYLAILLMQGLISCKKSTVRNNVVNEYQKFFGEELVEKKVEDSVIFEKSTRSVCLKYNADGNLIYVVNYLDKRAYGHYFKFDNGGYLNNYSYNLSQDGKYSYEMSRKFMTDSLIEKGSPFVDYMLYEKSLDSLKKVSLIFSLFPRSNLTIYTSTDGLNYQTASLYKSNNMPLLSELDLTVNTVQTKKIYIKISAGCNSNSPLILECPKNFLDTLYLENGSVR